MDCFLGDYSLCVINPKASHIEGIVRTHATVLVWFNLARLYINELFSHVSSNFRVWGLPLRGGGSGLLYISITYCMQKGGRGSRHRPIACKIAYVINGRSLSA